MASKFFVWKPFRTGAVVGVNQSVNTIVVICCDIAYVLYFDVIVFQTHEFTQTPKSVEVVLRLSRNVVNVSQAVRGIKEENTIYY